MAIRIEITTKTSDTRATVRQKKLQELIKKPLNCQIIDVYTIDKNLSEKQLESLASHLANSLTQNYVIARSKATRLHEVDSPLVGKQSQTRLPRSARNDDLQTF